MNLSKEQVDACFHGCANQQDWIVNVYKLVFKDWHRIQKIQGWPTIGKELSDYIWERATAFDKKYHSAVLPGGAWVNTGFSTDTSSALGPWEVSMNGVEVIY